MAYVGLHDKANQTFDFYYTIIETHSELIDETKDSVIEHALEVYMHYQPRLRGENLLFEGKD